MRVLDGRVHSIHVSNGGVPKRSVDEVRIRAEGLDGDRQAQREFHGGPTRAVSLWSLEVIEQLRGEGHPVAPGTAGENLTLTGIDWTVLGPGARIEIGQVLLEVTGFAKPCGTIAANFHDRNFMRIAHTKHPGSARLYARVLEIGTVRSGDRVRVVCSPELA